MENTDIYNVTTHATLKYSIQNFQMSNVKYQISVFNTEIGFHRIPTGGESEGRQDLEDLDNT